MLYGVDYRDFHTALHGILLFEYEGEADEAYRYLKSYEELYDEGKWETPEDYLLSVEAIFQRACDEIEEVDHREIQTIMITPYDKGIIKIVNKAFVDIY